MSNAINQNGTGLEQQVSCVHIINYYTAFLIKPIILRVEWFINFNEDI